MFCKLGEVWVKLSILYETKGLSNKWKKICKIIGLFLLYFVFFMYKRDSKYFLYFSTLLQQRLNFKYCVGFKIPCHLFTGMFSNYQEHYFSSVVFGQLDKQNLLFVSLVIDIPSQLVSPKQVSGFLSHTNPLHLITETDNFLSWKTCLIHPDSVCSYHFFFF